MRKTLFRMLAVALVALAVPVQGFAAVSAGLCMALGHHGDGPGTHDHGSSGVAHKGEHGAVADHHHDDGSGGDKGSHAHCPPCVSCCAAAAIASFPSAAISEVAADPLVPSPLVSSYGVAPDKLDRPPLAL